MRLSVSFISLALLSVTTPGFGKVYEQLGDLKQEVFDFVVVGGTSLLIILVLYTAEMVMGYRS